MKSCRVCLVWVCLLWATLLWATLLWATLLWAACAPRLPAQYVEERSAAQRAYAQGQYAQAAEHWDAAARTAPNDLHRDEARYRQAASLSRAGHAAQARPILERLANASAGERRARASFDLAYAEIRGGNPEAGYAALERAVLKFPDSGLSVRAGLRLLDRAGEHSGPSGKLELLTRLIPRTSGREIEQLFRYERARALEASGDGGAALAGYLDVIARYPYPRGRYWDEAILRAARLEAARGRAKDAIGRLRGMLTHREGATLTGSYERHYAEAHVLLAELLRDELGDLRAARDEFRLAARRYEHSRLRDDALWQAALCSRRLAEQEELCDDLAALRDLEPLSRYSACAHLLCPQLPARGTCRDYVLRELDAAPALDPPSP